jgi:hypothetical protein
MNTQEAIRLLGELKHEVLFPGYHDAITHAIEHMKLGTPDIVISKLYAIENGNAENVGDKDRVNIMRQLAKEALIELGVYHD